MKKDCKFKRLVTKHVLLLGFAVANLSGPSFASENVTEKLENTRDKTSAELEILNTQRDASSAALARLTEKIETLKNDQQSLQNALKQAEAKQSKLNQRAADSQKRLTKLEDDELVIKRSLVERNDVLAEVLAALQRLGSNPPPALLVKPEDALSSVRSAILLGAIVPEIRSETEKLLEDLQQLATIRDGIDRETIELTEALEQSIQEEKALTQLIQEKAALNVASLQQLEKEKARINELTSRSEELETVVASIDQEILSIQKSAEEARRVELERKRIAAENLERARQLARKNAKKDKQLAPGYAFSELRNTLTFPVNGILASQFGDEDSSGQIRQGITLTSADKADVKAPTDGWVVYSGSFRSYGKMVIIDAGEGYHIVMSGMGNVNVSQGQFVVKGEPIGLMGPPKQQNNDIFALASDKPTLYIELRKDQKTIDSAPWWADMTSGRVSNDT